jgi:hypothetical protein
MKRFHCACGNEVFFDNKFCNACGDTLGFIPEQQVFINPFVQNGYRLCQHAETLQCNWLIKDSDNNPQCCACRLTRTIPDLGINNNFQRWAKLEMTKRRAFYMLLRLGLSIPDRQPGANEPLLLFDFLEDQRTNPESALDFVYTGHAKGVITLNAAEADDSYLSAAQELMNEAYRTLLGHFRHELGHFYGLRLLNNAEDLAAFRQLFGDERVDYATALESFYCNGARQDWQDQFISSYASSHPLEDWAETWAHYLHISETLETACAYGLISNIESLADFNHWLSTWMEFSVALNALNRSMGTSDPYPFVISEIVKRKLYFIDCWVKKAGIVPCNI